MKWYNMPWHEMSRNHRTKTVEAQWSCPIITAQSQKPSLQWPMPSAQSAMLNAQTYVFKIQW